MPLAARALLYAGVAAAVARAPADTSALAAAALFTHQSLAHGAIAVRFGTETAASGAFSGGIGWLGATLLTALAAAPRALVAVTSASIVVTSLLVESRARRFSNPAAALVAACIAVLCMCDAGHEAGPLPAPLLLAGLLVLLDRPTLRGALLATGLTTLWCNLSPSGVLAPIFALAVAAGMWSDRMRGQRLPPGQLRAAWFTTVGTCAATLMTPAGSAYPALALRCLDLGGAFGGNVDAAPYVNAPVAYGVGLLLVLVLALAVGLRTQGFTAAIPALVALAFGLGDGNELPLVGVVVAPLLAAGAAPLVRPAAWPRFVLGAACIAVIVANVAPGDRAAHARRSASAAAPLAVQAAAMPAVRRLFCARPAWCTYAVAAGGSVLIDGRIDEAPNNVRAAQRDIAGADATWQHLALRYRVDALLVSDDSTLASLARLSPQWRVEATQNHTALFVRQGR